MKLDLNCDLGEGEPVRVINRFRPDKSDGAGVVLKIPLFERAVKFSGTIDGKYFRTELGNARLEGGDARQGLAFKPFKKCATCCGHIGEFIRGTRLIEGCNRIAAACNGGELA